ncbi:hypothetical protein BJQ97_01733 [Geobacillus sp. TFV-3]|nr:hypothetical protein BJQ97_01733 [Geobacillus sp. TFV-3]
MMKAFLHKLILAFRLILPLSYSAEGRFSGVGNLSPKRRGGVFPPLRY